MHRLSRQQILSLLGLATAIVVMMVILIAVAPPGRTCYYEYRIVLELVSGSPPWRSINLTPEDLNEYPLVDRVLKAFDDPTSYAPAHFVDAALRYPVVNQENVLATSTNSYLNARWGVGVYPLILTSVDGRSFTWALQALDPGDFGPCP